MVLFIDNRFDRIQSTQRSLQMIRRFENLNIPNFDIQEKYLRIIRHYSKDIENVMKVYNKSNKHPPIARNLPPTGKIF